MLKSMAWILPIYLKYQAYAPTSAPLRHPSEGRVDLAGDPRGGPHGQHLACLALANRRHPQRNHAPWQRSQPLRRAHAGLQRHRLRLPHHRAAVARTRVARRCRLRPRHQPQGQCDERGGRRQRRASGRHAIPPGYPAQQRNRRSVISRSQYRPHCRHARKTETGFDPAPITGHLRRARGRARGVVLHHRPAAQHHVARHARGGAGGPGHRAQHSARDPGRIRRDRHAIQRIARAPERGA